MFCESTTSDFQIDLKVVNKIKDEVARIISMDKKGIKIDIFYLCELIV